MIGLPVEFLKNDKIFRQIFGDKADILFSISFLNRALYEIMWKNMVKPGRPQMTI
jgi:hypothetical protein